VREVHAKGVYPEVICQFRIADGDMPGYAFAEAEFREQPER
jgi:hypothetical protein